MQDEPRRIRLFADKALAEAEADLVGGAHHIDEKHVFRLEFSVVGIHTERAVDLQLDASGQDADHSHARLLGDERRIALHPRAHRLDELLELRGTCAVHHRQLDVHTGGARAQVFSTTELGAVQLARIKDALQKSTGKKVVVESIVDPTLLGGLRIQVEGKVLDSTLLLQLEALRGLILTAA